jgi:hypothetical protein
MFTVVAYNGAVAAGIVYSPTLFYALTIVGGPQGVQGNPGAAGLQGPAGIQGATGAQGLQGVIMVNGYAGANSLITTGSSAGIVNAQSGLTYGGTSTTFNIASTVGTGVNSNTLTVGPGNGGNAIYTTGTINAAGTNAHTLGVVTFTNGAIANATTISNSGLHTTGTLSSGNITAPQVSASTGTFTIAANVSTSINTLTVSPPATSTNNAIYTTGTIYAGGANAHTLGVVTFTNGAIAGVTTIGASGKITAGSFSGPLTGNVTGNADNATTASNVSGGTISCTTFSNSTSAGSTFNGTFNGNASSSSSCSGNAATATFLNAGQSAGSYSFTVGNWYYSTDGLKRLYFGNGAHTYMNAPSGFSNIWQIANNDTMFLGATLLTTPSNITIGTLQTSCYSSGWFMANGTTISVGPLITAIGYARLRATSDFSGGWVAQDWMMIRTSGSAYGARLLYGSSNSMSGNYTAEVSTGYNFTITNSLGSSYNIYWSLYLERYI